jgi:hypothetical protein
VPQVFEKHGFRFGFYSNDHEPVHVVKPGAEAIFDVLSGVELRESRGFRLADLAKAQQPAQHNRQLIVDKWHEHFGK